MTRWGGRGVWLRFETRSSEAGYARPVNDRNTMTEVLPGDTMLGKVIVGATESSSLEPM